MANDLKMTISADSTSAMAVLSSFGQQVKGVTSEVEGHFGRLGQSIQGLMAPIAAVTAILGGGALFKGAIDGAIGLQKETMGLQRLFGGTTEEATVTTVAVRSIFGDTEGYEAAGTKLVKTLNKNESAITSMGVATRDSKGHFRDMSDLLPEVVQALTQYSEGADRDAMAQTIFGRSFKDVLVYAKLTPQVMDEARKKAHDYGLELDSQARGTILSYRQSMVNLDEAFLGLKTRVALEVMPSLTSLATWFGETAPTAIAVVGGALSGLRDLLGYTTVQVVLLGMALKGLASIRIVSAAWDGLRLVGMYALDGVAGLKVLGSSLVATVGVTTIAVAAFAALGFGIEYLAKAEDRRHAAEMASIHAAGDQVSTAQELQAKYAELAEALDKGALKGKEKTAALAKLKVIEDQIIAISPEYQSILSKETGSYMAMAEAVKAVNAEKLKDLENRRAVLALDLKRAEAQEAALAAPAAPAGNQYDKSPAEGEMGQVITNTIGLAQASARVQNLKAEIQGLDAELHKLDEKKATKGTPIPTAQGTPSDYQTQRLQLLQEEITLQAKITLQQQEKNAWDEAGVKLEQERDRIKKDKSLKPGEGAKLEAQAEANYSQRMLNISAEYDLKRTQMEDDLQGKLDAAGEGGMARRLEAIRKNFEEIRKLNKQLADDGQTSLTEEQLKDAQDANEARATAEQVKADLSKLKEEISQATQIGGGSLSSQDRDKILGRWDAKGGTSASASALYKQENNVGAGPGDGFKAGVTAYTTAASDAFTVMKTLATGILSGLEGAFTNFFTSLTQRGTTFGEKMKALWSGLSQSVVQSLAKMAAQQVTNWIVDKAVLAWQELASLWRKGDTDKQLSENTAKQASGTATAAVNTEAQMSTTGPWGWLAGFAAVAAVLALLGSLSGREAGGPVTAGTPYIVGEKRPELFVPKQDGIIVPNLDNLGGNIGRAQSLSRNYSAQASGYSSAAQGGAQQGGAPTIHVDLRGATVLSKAELGRTVWDAIQGEGSRRNVRFTPGGTLGRA